jgi:hypothetical protein
LERLKIEVEKAKEYQKELEILRMDEEENEENILNLEKGIVFQNVKLSVSMGLRSEIYKSKHDMKVAGNMGQDSTNEVIRRNF